LIIYNDEDDSNYDYIDVIYKNIKKIEFNYVFSVLAKWSTSETKELNGNLSIPIDIIIDDKNKSNFSKFNTSQYNTNDGRIDLTIFGMFNNQDTTIYNDKYYNIEWEYQPDMKYIDPIQNPVKNSSDIDISNYSENQPSANITYKYNNIYDGIYLVTVKRNYQYLGQNIEFKTTKKIEFTSPRILNTIIETNVTSQTNVSSLTIISSGGWHTNAALEIDYTYKWEIQNSQTNFDDLSNDKTIEYNNTENKTYRWTVIDSAPEPNQNQGQITVDFKILIDIKQKVDYNDIDKNYTQNGDIDIIISGGTFYNNDSYVVTLSDDIKLIKH